MVCMRRIYLIKIINTFIHLFIPNYDEKDIIKFVILNFKLCTSVVLSFFPPLCTDASEQFPLIKLQLCAN